MMSQPIIKTKRKNTMPKKYVLKRDLTSTAKVQRLVKTVQVNAQRDREIATELQKKVYKELDTFLETAERDAFNTDAFTKMVTASVQALNQMGIANERLLKLASLLMKYNAEKEKSKAKDPMGDAIEKGESIFDALKKITSGEEDD